MNTLNRRAFLDTIAFSEIGAALLAASDDGYNVLVGSTPSNPSLFTSYADHPRRLVLIRPGLESTAAGRYQVLARYFDVYQKQLNLPDFGHDSQDAIAIQMATECHALNAIDSGDIESALTACASRWASLPGAGYNQHENAMSLLVAAFESAGGVSA